MTDLRSPLSRLLCSVRSRLETEARESHPHTTWRQSVLIARDLDLLSTGFDESRRPRPVQHAIQSHRPFDADDLLGLTYSASVALRAYTESSRKAADRIDELRTRLLRLRARDRRRHR